MDEKIRLKATEVLSNLSLEELKKLTPEKISTLEESRKLYFSVLKNIIEDSMEGKDRVEILNVLGEISKQAMDSSASAFAREIQKGTEKGEESDEGEKNIE